MEKVQVFLVPFLAFASTFSASKVHNMLVLILDPHFKSLDAMKVVVRRAKVIQMVVEYDTKTLMPLLVAAFRFLNPSTNGFTKLTPVDDNKIPFFGQWLKMKLFCKGWWKTSCVYPFIYMWILKIIYCPWQLGGSPIKHNFHTFLLWPNRFSRFLGPRWKLREFSSLLECW